MNVVEITLFNSDDYEVSTDVIPCDSKETAKKVVEKALKKIIGRIGLLDKEVEEWTESHVTRRKDGSIYIRGYEAGYAEINIIDKEPITADTLDSLEIKTKTCWF